MATEETPTCQGCGRPNPIPAWVHEGCRQRAAEQLAEIPRLAELLVLGLVPGGTGRNDGVKHRKPDAAPLPLRLDAFNLLGRGTLDVDLREIAHQIGVPPLGVWLDAWYADWAERYDFGPQAVPGDNKPAGGNPALARHLLTRSKLIVGYVYGAGDGHPIMGTISDTLDAEHAARFGRPDNTAINTVVAALASRLDEACDHHERIGDFLAGLRIMVGACKSVVGEQSDLTYLGRCPEVRRDRDSGMEEPCNGALWQDPYVKRIQCPRCKTEWPEKRWLWLGRLIRDQAAETAEVHRFAAELVVINADPHAVPPVAADRYWATSCACGQWSGQVRGKKLDARGRWRLHVDEASAPMVEQVDERIGA